MLRSFFMEDWLETHRFQATYNFGESGAEPRTLAELCELCDEKPETTFNELIHLSLRDSPNRGRDDLRSAIAALHPGASADNVLVTTGTSEALFLLLHVLRPRKLALAVPAFQLLYEIPLHLGCEIVPLAITWQNDASAFVDEAEWLDTLNAERPDVVLLNSPHNPSGLIFSETFISKVTKIVSSWGGTLIGDEHYRFFMEDYSGVCGPTLYRNNPQIFVTGSFIKCLGVPGLRIGWCVGEKKTLDAMQNFKNYTTHTVSPITEAIAVMVLKKLDTKVLTPLWNQWNLRRNELRQFQKNNPSFRVAMPQGGLVTCLFHEDIHTQNDVSDFFAFARERGHFLLPLSSMEGQRWKTQGGRDVSLGFRLGLGAKNFAVGLSHLAEVASSYFGSLK